MADVKKMEAAVVSPSTLSSELLRMMVPAPKKAAPVITACIILIGSDWTREKPSCLPDSPTITLLIAVKKAVAPATSI
jgi:hypothetical protein